MKNLLTTLLVLVSCVASINAQSSKQDSLLSLLQTHQLRDTTHVELLYQLAYSFRESDLQKTYQYAKEACALADSIDYPKGKAAGLSLLGHYYTYTSDFEQARKCLEQSLAISNEIKSSWDSLNAMANLGTLYLYYPDSIGKAAEYLRRCIQISEEHGYKSAKGRLMMNLGSAYWQLSEFMKAIDLYQEALAFFIEQNDELKEGMCLGNIGLIYFEYGEDSLALDYLKKGAEIMEKYKNNIYLMDLYMNLGSILNSLNRKEEALHYFRKSLKIAKQMGDLSLVASNLLSIAVVERYMGAERQEVLKKLFRAAEISDSIGYNIGLAGSYIPIANTYLLDDNMLKAREYTQKAMKLSTTLGDLKMQRDCYELLFKINREQQNYQNAMNYHVLYKTYSDSIINESDIKKLARLEKQYEFEKEKQEIALEQAKKEAIQEAKLKQQRLLTGVFIGGFVLVLLLVFVILRSLLLKRKANKMLALQKEEITSQAKQLKITNEKLVELDQFKQGMTSMVVHDLKNPLNTILNVADNELTRQAAGQMLNLVLNILDVNKYENTQMIITKASLPVFKNLQKAIEQVTFFVEQKKILIENKIDKTCWVEGDPVIVERIFVNLLSNAVKYTPVNGNIEVSGDIDEKNGNVVISVKDTGKGIPKEYHNKVFEKFAQIDAKNTGNLSSTGLGLTFCKIAVEAHGGKIWIDNSYSEGTCVSFILPVSYVSQEMIDERIIASNSNQLTKQESQVLQKYLPQFLNLELYEITAFRKLFHEIEKEGKANSGWLQQLKDAVDYENRIQFENLINSHI